MTIAINRRVTTDTFKRLNTVRTAMNAIRRAIPKGADPRISFETSPTGTSYIRIVADWSDWV